MRVAASPIAAWLFRRRQTRPSRADGGSCARKERDGAPEGLRIRDSHATSSRQTLHGVSAPMLLEGRARPAQCVNATLLSPPWRLSRSAVARPARCNVQHVFVSSPPGARPHFYFPSSLFSRSAIERPFYRVTPSSLHPPAAPPWRKHTKTSPPSTSPRCLSRRHSRPHR